VLEDCRANQPLDLQDGFAAGGFRQKPRHQPGEFLLLEAEDRLGLFFALPTVPPVSV
jgi:hypothetical protein